MQMQNGTYDAHLISARSCLSRVGKPMIEFFWRIDDTEQTIKSYLHLQDRDGQPNQTGIRFTCAWAKDWDGVEPEWFERHLDLIRAYPVSLRVENLPLKSDPSRIVSQVRFVNPRQWTRLKPADGEGSAASAVSAAPALREFDPSRLAALPDDIEPTMQGVWSAFCFVTEGWRVAEREARWFDLVARARPNTDQIRFDAADWQEVSNLLAASRTRDARDALACACAR